METFAKPTDGSRPMRADARRNRERVMQAARELFGSLGRDASMEDISLRAGVGVGTIYRHFPTKNALLTALVKTRFAEMAELARVVEREVPTSDALAEATRRQTEAVATDKGFQLGVLGWEALDPAEVEPEVAGLATVTQRLIDRAVADGLVRPDVTSADIGMLMCGVTAIMYFKPEQDWRRYLDFLLSGLRP